MTFQHQVDPSPCLNKPSMILAMEISTACVSCFVKRGNEKVRRGRLSTARSVGPSLVGMIVLLLLLLLFRNGLQALESYRSSVFLRIVNVVTAIPVAGRNGLAVNLDGA